MKFHLLTMLFLIGTACAVRESNKELLPEQADRLIYYNEDGLQAVKKEINAGNNYYAEALNTVLKEADQYLKMEPDPVINKSQIPPNGDKHDYLSLAPYWWPNPESSDGLPWIRKDGEVNPMTRGENTDKARLSQLWAALECLSFAFYYTDDIAYANKAKELIRVWFVDPKTKVNPNANFGQGIPGINNGRPFGIIEWRGIAYLITTLQMLEQKEVLDPEIGEGVKQWLQEFLDWLENSELGREEGTRKNNHANWYDYQVVGLSIFLGKKEAAIQRTEAAKYYRIESQIAKDGAQPHEIARTKSLSYSTMNLKAMVLVGTLADQVGVDLLQFQSTEGKSLMLAADFLKPYALGEQDWPHPQISEGSWPAVVEGRLVPLFSTMSTIYQKRLLPETIKMEEKISHLERLQYPPLLYTQADKMN